MSKALIIAELSGNHNQDYGLAVESIYAAKSAGADAVKLQTYTADMLTIDAQNDEFGPRKTGIWKGQTPHEVFTKGALPYDWHMPLFTLARELGLQCFSTPFSEPAVDFLETINNPIYKIASFEIGHLPLLEKIASTGKPVIISTGKASLNDIEVALSYFPREQVTLLKCTSAYPSLLRDANLNALPEMADKFKCKVGLSDHTTGIIAPLIAVSLGASVIEKHFVLDRSTGGIDSEFSLEPSEFQQMVHQIRDVESSFGHGIREFQRSDCTARTIYASRDIAVGEKLDVNNIRVVRGEKGLKPSEFEFLIGKPALQTVIKGQPITLTILGDNEISD